jgi:hypothetical protein
MSSARAVYPRPMFEPRFIQHRGVSILRLEFSHLSGPEVVAAAVQVQRVIAAEPLHSVRTLTILSARLTADGADALKRGALANGPYVRAGAVVATSFWKVIANDVQMHGREDIMLFDDEASALDWLASQ